MRLSLILLLLPMLVGAQSYVFPQKAKREIRIGVLTQLDSRLQHAYIATRNTPVLRAQRTSHPSLVLDYQLLKDKEFLFATTGIGYMQIDIPTDYEYSVTGLTAYPLAFQESAAVDYLQFSLGIGTELFGRSRFSPYIHANALIALPLDTDYIIQFEQPSELHFPDYIHLQGGTKASLGFQIRSGLRIHLHRRLSMGAGLYYANLPFKQNWPALPRRSMKDTFLKLDKGGVEFFLQYRFNQRKQAVPIP